MVSPGRGIVLCCWETETRTFTVPLFTHQQTVSPRKPDERLGGYQRWPSIQHVQGELQLTPTDRFILRKLVITPLCATPKAMPLVTFWFTSFRNKHIKNREREG